MAEEPTTMTELKGIDLPAMPLDELLATLREGYTGAISDVLDAVLATLILPKQQEAVCVDAAQFLTFILAVKIVANNRQPMDSRNLMQAYRLINKSIEKDVPGMLVAFAREVPANQVQPARLEEKQL